MNDWLKIDSINFKNAIIQSQRPFELPEFAKDIEEMIIEEDFGNDYFGNLVIENYPNLEKIVVKKNSLKNMYSLKICNNEKLKTIELEDGDDNVRIWRKGAFLNVVKVIIESISIILFDIFKSS